MRLEQLELTGGGTLTLYLRESVEAMPHFRHGARWCVVVPGAAITTQPPEATCALQVCGCRVSHGVLHYAVGESARDALPMRQLAQAIGLVRQHAEQWNILPDKIALCGFSAGGHLALSGAVWDIPGMADQPRPNALLLAYPVVTAEEYAHRGSFVQLTGTQDTAAHRRFSLEDKVSPTTPPVFVWHTMEDETVPVENTLLLLGALHKAGVPCEAHLFEKGCHGTSISTPEVDADSAHRHHWVQLAVEWLNRTFCFSA